MRLHPGRGETQAPNPSLCRDSRGMVGARAGAVDGAALGCDGLYLFDVVRLERCEHG